MYKSKFIENYNKNNRSPIYNNQNKTVLNTKRYSDDENNVEIENMNNVNYYNHELDDPRSTYDFEDQKKIRRMIRIGKAEFSPSFFIASILIFISGILTLCAFAGPYWSQSWPSTGNDFKNIGLWEACFNRYRHWKDDNQKPYTGCFWFWSPDMIRFRDWIMPPWFIAVQFFACFGLIFVFVVLAFLSIAFITNIRSKFYFIFPITILTFTSHVMMFLTLLIYGINGDNREWMPRPEFNVYSWSYWFQLSAAFFLLIATVLLMLESRVLYAIHKKHAMIKRQYESALPLNSNIQLNINASLSNSGHYA